MDRWIRFVVYGFLLQVSLSSASQAADGRSWDFGKPDFNTEMRLKTTKNEEVVLVLNNFSLGTVVISPKGNFCSHSSTVTAWYPVNDVTLVIDGVPHYHNFNHSHGWMDNQDTGLAHIFYYNSFSFKNFDQCMKAAETSTNIVDDSYVSPIVASDLKWFRLSFYAGPPMAITSQVDYVLKFNLVERQVTLLKLEGANHFEFNSWKVFAKGSL